MTEDQVQAAVAVLDKPETVAGQLETYAEGVDAEGWHSTANVMLRGAKTIKDLVELNAFLERRITGIMQANNALVEREREAKLQARMAENRAKLAERELAKLQGLIVSDIPPLIETSRLLGAASEEVEDAIELVRHASA